MTLDDLERPKHILAEKNNRFTEPTRKKNWMKIDTHYQRQNVGQWFSFIEI